MLLCPIWVTSLLNKENKINYNLTNEKANWTNLLGLNRRYKSKVFGVKLQSLKTLGNKLQNKNWRTKIAISGIGSSSPIDENCRRLLLLSHNKTRIHTNRRSTKKKKKKRKPARQNLSKVSLLPGKLTIIFRQALYLLEFHLPQTHKRRSFVLFVQILFGHFFKQLIRIWKLKEIPPHFSLDKGPEFFFISTIFSPINIKSIHNHEITYKAIGN